MFYSSLYLDNWCPDGKCFYLSIKLRIFTKNYFLVPYPRFLGVSIAIVANMKKFWSHLKELFWILWPGKITLLFLVIVTVPKLVNISYIWSYAQAAKTPKFVENQVSKVICCRLTKNNFPCKIAFFNKIILYYHLKSVPHQTIIRRITVITSLWFRCRNQWTKPIIWRGPIYQIL